MTIPNNDTAANGAVDTVSFLTETVPNPRQLVFVHLVDPKPRFTPGASRTHAVLASTVEQMTATPVNVVLRLPCGPPDE
jgi:hypothetical protein